MHRTWKLELAAAACAMMLLSAGPSHASAQDPWITAKVKISLMTARDVHAMPIDVDTYNGHVTLHGRVNSLSERERAMAVASSVHGVRDVRNLLQVVPEDQRPMVRRQDRMIENDVSDALAHDPALDHSSIHVKSVNRGLVLLSGNASSVMAEQRALELAADVPGARRVASEIHSPSRIADREVWNDRNESASDMRGRDTRDRDVDNRDHYDSDHHDSRISDAWITARTKMDFVADSDIPAGDINVDTHDREVTLFGIVPSQGVADKAERVARNVHGVTDVRNELRVVPSSMHSTVTHRDDVLQDALQHRLDNANFNGANIHVEVRDGVARLSGMFSRQSDHYEALRIVRGTNGVSRVRDDLQWDNRQASGD